MSTSKPWQIGEVPVVLPAIIGDDVDPDVAQKIWAAVLWQAIFDLKKGLEHLQTPDDQFSYKVRLGGRYKWYEAAYWKKKNGLAAVEFFESNDVECVCHNAGINPDIVREWYQGVMYENRPMPANVQRARI